MLHRTACAGSCYWSLQGPRSFGSRRHCASSARVQASGLKVYIYKFLYICACALLLFLIYYLFLSSVFTTCALYSHYIKFYYLCAAVVRMFYIYLLVLFLTYIYLPLDKGVAGGVACEVTASASSTTFEVVLYVGPAKLGGVGTVAGAAHSPSRGGCPGTFVGQRCYCEHIACMSRPMHFV